MKIRRRELENRVLHAIRENGEGLTWSQIGLQTGSSLPRALLTHLQREGKIKQKKRLLPNGTITFVYVVDEAKMSAG